MQRWFVVATVGLFATSWIVRFEPAPYDIMMVGLAVLLFTGKFLRIPSDQRWALVALGLFVAANLVSLPFSKSVPTAIFAGAITMYLAGSWLLFISIRTEYHRDFVKAALHGYCIAATMAALTGILATMQFIPFWEHLTYGGLRAQSLFKDPNVFGPFLVPMVLYALDHANRSVGKQSWRWLILAGVLASAVVLSFSRGAWLNFLVSMVVFLALHMTRTIPFARRLKNAVVAGLISLCILGLAMTRPEIPSLLLARVKLQHYDYDRFENQLAIVKTVSPGLSQRDSTADTDPEVDPNNNSQSSSTSHANPKVDLSNNSQSNSTSQTSSEVDTDNTSAQSGAASRVWTTLWGRGPGQSEVWFGMSPHNLYLRVWFEHGIVGLVGLLALIVLSLRKLCVHSRSGSTLATVILASIIGILVNSMFIDTHHWRHFWVLLAIPWLLPSNEVIGDTDIS